MFVTVCTIDKVAWHPATCEKGNDEKLARPPGAVPQDGAVPLTPIVVAVSGPSCFHTHG